MKCFVHDEVQAVGTCAVCGKGICRAYARDNIEIIGITCSEICKNELSELREANRRSKKIYGIGTREKIPITVWMWVLFGALFGGYGILPYFTEGVLGWYHLVFSGTCFLLALMTWKRSRATGIQC